MRNINKIIIHCSATKAGQDFKAADIDRWHKERGFDGIGYHYVIDLDGSVERGRDIEKVGAHCQGYNSHSIGICYIGGLDNSGNSQDTRTEAQKSALWALLRELLCKYPDVTIHGHREFAAKDCPCFDVNREYHDINLK